MRISSERTVAFPTHLPHLSLRGATVRSRLLNASATRPSVTRLDGRTQGQQGVEKAHGPGGNSGFGFTPLRSVTLDQKGVVTKYKIIEMTKEAREAVKLAEGDILLYPEIIY